MAAKKPSPKSTRRAAVSRLTTAEYRALGEFRRALRQFLAVSQAGSQAQGITSQQHQALLAIRSHIGFEPMTIGELAECLLIKHQSAVGLVARLVEVGLVRRVQSAADRRRVLLELEPR